MLFIRHNYVSQLQAHCCTRKQVIIKQLKVNKSRVGQETLSVKGKLILSRGTDWTDNFVDDRTATGILTTITRERREVEPCRLQKVTSTKQHNVAR